jgi:hypothetical protein
MQMTDATTETTMKTRPYKPSWIDRFTEWVERLPVQGWVFYGGLGLVLVLIQLLFLWLDGGLHLGTLLPVIIFNALAIPYSLALIQLLDNQAVTALNSMRPTLAITGPELDELQYRLSTMPSGPTYIVGLALMIFLILTERMGVVPVRYAALDDLPVFTIVYHVIDKSIPLLVGPFVYHTIAQLRLVNTIYSNHTRINLFDIKPLYAFSKLTASTAAGLVVTAYAWMLINPELLTDPVGLAGTAPFALLAVAVFVWPLIGAHRLMDMEKERMLHELDLQFEAVFAVFNQRLHDSDYTAMEGLNATIASLEIQQRRIKGIPTWPWRTETVRSVLAVIALPPVLSAIQFLVERAFSR